MRIRAVANDAFTEHPIIVSRNPYYTKEIVNMKIQISNRHETAHPTIKTIIEQELESLGSRYDILGADIILDHEGKNGSTIMSAEIALKVKGSVLIAKEKSEKVEKSVDLAMRAIEKQLKRHKETHYSSQASHEKPVIE